MINKSRFIALALGAGSLAAVAACGKDARQDISAPVNPVAAYVKFFNYSVGLSSPGVDFYANTQKITAISTGNCYGVLPSDTATTNKCLTAGIESKTGTAYNVAANGGLYSQLAPGQYTFAGDLAATTTTVSSISTTVADQKFYSYYQTGVYNSTAKTAEAFFVEDPIPAITDYSVAYVRLVNAMPGSSPMTLVAYDSASKKQVAITAAPVAYKTAGAFATVPAGSWTLLTSGGGVANPAAPATFIGGHVYSVAARGDYTSSVTANKPGLTTTANW
jgi:hypothetical protein